MMAALILVEDPWFVIKVFRRIGDVGKSKQFEQFAKSGHYGLAGELGWLAVNFWLKQVDLAYFAGIGGVAGTSKELRLYESRWS